MEFMCKRSCGNIVISPTSALQVFAEERLGFHVEQRVFLKEAKLEGKQYYKDLPSDCNVAIMVKYL